MKPLTKETFKIFWSHAKRYPAQIAIIVACAIVLPIVQTYVPTLYKELINIISSERNTGAFTRAVYLIILIFALNALSGMVIRRAINLASTSLQRRVMKDLMYTAYRTLEKHSVAFFNSTFVGSLVTKVKRYERSFERIADQITYDMGRAILIIVTILIFVLFQYPAIGAVLFAWIVVFFLFSYFFARFKLKYDIWLAGSDTRVTGQLADAITNNINVKSFGNYGLEDRRFEDVLEEQSRLRKKSWNMQAIGDTIQSAIWVFLEATIIYMAVKMWLNGLLTVGDIVMLQIYLVRVVENIWNTSKNTKNIYEALADANEMTEILLQKQDVVDAPMAGELKAKKGEIDFKNVSFTYHEGVAVLRDFNLRISPGERIALVGPSGGGKSTIIKLLFRFYDIDSGEILIDGQNIAKTAQDSLRASLALVPQDPILFHRSLMENIRYARPSATDEGVMEAARLAHVHEFVSTFPDGYGTLVGERGIKLSGGERQRVAIARAILKNAPILVLDEATSSLDSESEMLIQDALKKLMKGKTTIVVAHRLSTIMQMDRILVIENGAVTEEGKHKELIKVKKGTYQRLWNIQAGGFAGQ